MKVRVQTRNREIVTIELSGEWRVEPVDLHCLVGPTELHRFTPDGYYDHAERRPDPAAPPVPGPRPTSGLDVGPAEGTACVP
jgi:hypothetical protein